MKKMSKFLSLLMVMAMLSMLVPVSALAASNEETAVIAENELQLVLVTNEVPIAEVNDSDQAATEKTVLTTAAAEQLAADELMSADKTSGTQAVSEQPKISDSVPVIVEADAMATQAATYLCLTQNGVIIDVIATNIGDDYAYDAATNELTLNNFIGEKLDVKSAEVPFKLVLLGTNVLKTDNTFAVRVEGDMNASGTGTLVAEGQATPDLMGGGINVVGNLVIDSGTYDIAAVGYGNSSSAVGILAGDNAEFMTMGNLTINGGNIDVTAYNSDFGGAFGLFAFGDLVINGGNIDVFTDSPVSFSRGIGAFDNLIVNGGYSTVESIAENGDAGALFSYNKISINNGILDLCTRGAIAKALVAEGSIDISPIYGDVNRDAACLYLEPLSTQAFKKHHASSANPKTGVEPTAADAAVAAAALLAVIGLAYTASKRKTEAE